MNSANLKYRTHSLYGCWKCSLICVHVDEDEMVFQICPQPTSSSFIYSRFHLCFCFCLFVCFLFLLLLLFFFSPLKKIMKIIEYNTFFSIFTFVYVCLFVCFLFLLLLLLESTFCCTEKLLMILIYSHINVYEDM